MPAMPRVGYHSEGSADLELGARSANGVGTSAARLDSGLAETPGRHSAGDAHAGLLARVSEVVLPAVRRRCRGADSGDSRSLADVARRTQPEDAERQLGPGKAGRAGSGGSGR